MIILLLLSSVFCLDITLMSFYSFYISYFSSSNISLSWRVAQVFQSWQFLQLLTSISEAYLLNTGSALSEWSLGELLWMEISILLSERGRW